MSSSIGMWMCAGHHSRGDLVIVTDVDEDRVPGQFGPAERGRSHVDGVLRVVAAMGVEVRDRLPAGNPGDGDGLPPCVKAAVDGHRVHQRSADPVRILIVSIAMAEPMLPHNGPRTPATEQSGTLPGAGTSG